MAISEQRIALFAMISEFEEDARTIIQNYIVDDHCLSEDIGAEAFENLKKRSGYESNSNTKSTRELLQFLDIGDAVKCLLSNRSILPHKCSSALNKSSKLLNNLASIRNRVMRRRPLDFDDFPQATDLFRSILKGDRENFPRTHLAFESVSSGRFVSNYLNLFSFENEPSALNNLPQPDFDDTGFLGRSELIDDLKKAIAGPYPVITVLGVGGAGKSALALHAAYDILNSQDCPFDAIIWTSAKTSRLTGSDVEEITGAISTSVGIAEAALREFSEDAGDNPFEKVRFLLENFKVLLFIDNLETVLDEKVRAFVRTIPLGSKVVFTSRIGLGAYDFVIPVGNLEPKQASMYFRRVASVWKQAEFYNGSSDVVSQQCTRLNNSPLGIKWFIQAVASGASPQRILANPKSLIIFCLENIISNLSFGAKMILNVLAITGREQSPASIHFISGIETWDVEEHLRELISSNLITVISSKFGEEDRYKISNLAQSYISRQSPPSVEDQADVRRKQAQLTALSERAEGEVRDGFVFDPSYIFIRKEFSGTDSVAATYLRRAIVSCNEKRYDEAFDFVESGKNIAPGYFEVYRVEALVSAEAGNTIRAKDAYDEALALKGDYPPLRLWFGNFLVKFLGNGAEAERVLGEACKIDGAPEVQIELARARLYQHKYNESRETLHSLKSLEFKNIRTKRMYYDIYLQTFTRFIENNIDDSLEKIIKSLEGICNILDEIRSNYFDSRIEVNLRSVVGFVRSHISILDHSNELDCVWEYCAKISKFILTNTNFNYGTRSSMGLYKGEIVRVVKLQPFGFIKCIDGLEYFFHKNNFVNKADFQLIYPGCKVSFLLGENLEGVCANQVIIEEVV